MSEVSRSERLLNLVSFLLKASRPVSWSRIRSSVAGYREMQGSLPSLERRFERDKAALRELGVPLKFVSEEEEEAVGYTIPRDAYFLPRVEVTPAEAALLSGIGRLALEQAAGPMSDAIRSALLKLQFDTPFPSGMRETAEERFLLHRGAAAVSDGANQNLRELTAAILNRRAVRFTYRGLERERARQRTLEPYGIGYADGRWYVVGRDYGRKEIRVFRADRIRGAVRRVHEDGTRAEFETPKNFRVQDYIGVPPWLFGRKQRTAVRIRIDRDAAFMVRMRPAPGDTWEMLPDGSSILTRVATDLDALLNWALELGPHAEVLDPPEFRRRMAEALDRIIAQHEDAPREGGRS